MERVADVVLNPSQNVYGQSTNETEKPNLEYGKKVAETTAIREAEAKSAIIAAKQNQSQIGENIMTVDATKQGEPLNEASVTPVADTQIKSALSKVEEKAFRKYVESFINEASDIKNPTKRLKEMAEILEMFEEGVAPDLREALEDKLISERNNLEQLVESAIDIKEEFGADDLDTLKENAKKIATEGVLLSENVEDYKILVEGLTERNRKLIKENKAFEIKLRLREARLDKAEKGSNDLKVGSSAQINALLEEMEDIKHEKASLQETIKKLSSTNKLLERDNGVIKTKLDETRKEMFVIIQKTSKTLNETTKNSAEVKQLQETVATYEQMISRLQEKNKKLITEKQDTVAEFEAYKTKIREDSDMSLHVQPAYKERVSGMLNFRENSGIEIESYWSDLVKRYNESVLPYERQIRGAKTLREATSSFMRYRNEIDPDFGAADNARITEGFIPVQKRAQILQEAGMDLTDNRELDDVNAEFLANAKKMGLK
jgi:DNA repair exonuclease SbcCD ATPase subunit